MYQTAQTLMAAWRRMRQRQDDDYEKKKTNDNATSKVSSDTDLAYPLRCSDPGVLPGQRDRGCTGPAGEQDSLIAPIQKGINGLGSLGCPA